MFLQVLISLDFTEYVLSHQKLNWDDAGQKCKGNSGDLVTINNANENARILGLIRCSPDDYWIGLNDIQTEGIFKWISSNTTPSFTNWNPANPREPNNYFGEDCVVLRELHNFKWNDVPCRSKHRFICELRRSKIIKFIYLDLYISYCLSQTEATLSNSNVP